MPYIYIYTWTNKEWFVHILLPTSTRKFLPGPLQGGVIQLYDKTSA